jgi:hypothetical protein
VIFCCIVLLQVCERGGGQPQAKVAKSGTPFAPACSGTAVGSATGACALRTRAPILFADENSICRIVLEKGRTREKSATLFGTLILLSDKQV